MDNNRSPMDNLFNMLSGFGAGHEKALKQGIYNALALFLLCLVSAAGYGLYIILSPFVKPLIWALLCGSVLFPFKCSLASTVQSWFDKIEATHRPFLVNVTLLPLQIVDESSEILGSFLWKNIRYIIAALLTVSLSLLAYHYTPNILMCLIWRMSMVIGTILDLAITACNTIMVTTIVTAYLLIVYFYWTPENVVKFRWASFLVWCTISLYLSNIFGVYQVWMFITLQALYLFGFIYEIILNMEQEELNGQHMTFVEAVYFTVTNDSPSEQKDKAESMHDAKPVDDLPWEDTDTFVEKPVNPSGTDTSQNKLLTTASVSKLCKKSMSLDTDLSSHAPQRKLHPGYNTSSPSTILRERYLLKRLKSEFRMSIDLSDNTVDTDKYMYAALYACIGMTLWKHKWVLHILIIPVAYYVIKQAGCYFGFWGKIHAQYESVTTTIKAWCKERYMTLLPANIRGLYKIGIIVDQKVTMALKSSVDAVATIAVILGLLVFTICTSIFITIQVYAEGMHLIQMTGEILNSSLMNNPDIDWVPKQWEESMNSVLDNAYTYGRTAISDGVKGFVKDMELAKAEQLEKKILELWDRLYQAWMMSNDDPQFIGPTVDVAAAYSVWESFKDSFGKMPLQIFNMTSIQNFAKENVGFLTSILDSLWSIVKGNMSIILSIFTESFYIILISGSAVLNFVLSMVVFFTTLFYLLSSSGKTYKPIELTTMFSPISIHRFAIALQEAVIGVFAATFKLASFFGMWTWFIHNLFQVKIVYLPAAFATILGAVPFLDAYFACIPATIELWFTRGSMIAILFFMFHFLACNIVVTEFYKEIKGGGHPYLTGLSIAGGIFCLGVEGAIFGPLLLCCIMVAINLSQRYLQSPTVDVLSTYRSIQNS